MSAGDDSRGRPLPPDLGRLLHDLRGPLNSLTMHLEVLRRSAGEAPIEGSVRTMQEQLARLGAMLPSAFAIAALELTTSGPVDLRAVAAAAGASASGPVTLAQGPWPTVRGDAALLRLALAHLLRNAIEATSSAGRTEPPEVHASQEGDEVRVAVRDRGPGFRTTNANLLIKLMHSSKPGHAGVGLLTVERIARLHGGTLRFESPGDGAVVTLVLRR
jgi:two-component system, NtrC family, sensor histidine kinase HydH